jgi:hypothetical protein
MGGLGNQMFQYAAVRALSLKRKTPFAVDFDDPYKYAIRNFGLDVFELNYQTPTSSQLFKAKPKTKVLRRLYKWTGNNPDAYLYTEQKDFQYQPEFFTCPDGAYISGFWQSEKYFSDYADVIRKDFTFAEPASGQNLTWLEQIKSYNSISVHIRRGDYVSVEKINQIHGTCDLDYYERAIALIASKTEEPVFFFFSDDIEWVKANLTTNYPVHYIDNNTGETAHQDMRLMSNCKHHIIANSSFSWWGAWLNPDPGKVVIAPKRWMSNVEVNQTDLIPDSWITL